MTSFEAAAREVAAAWNNPGPVPIYHQQMQVWLAQEWPTLALAVAKLAALEEPKEGRHVFRDS